MSSHRGVTLVEALVAVAILALIALLLVIPAYLDYAGSRTASDAAATLAQDISLLERTAQNGAPYSGATLIVVAVRPFSYAAYIGRPQASDPQSTLGNKLVERTFAGVALMGGPIGPQTPLIFARNGSAQYAVADSWADQHQTIEFQLAPAGGRGRAARVDLQLFTGAVSLP